MAETRHNPWLRRRTATRRGQPVTIFTYTCLCGGRASATVPGIHATPPPLDWLDGWRATHACNLPPYKEQKNPMDPTESPLTNSAGKTKAPFCSDGCRQDFIQSHAATIRAYQLREQLPTPQAACDRLAFTTREERDTCAWCRSLLPDRGPLVYTLGVLRKGETFDQVETYLGFGAEIEEWIGEPTDRYRYAVISVPPRNAEWMCTRLMSGLRGGASRYDTLAAAQENARLDLAALNG